MNEYIGQRTYCPINVLHDFLRRINITLAQAHIVHKKNVFIIGGRFSICQSVYKYFKDDSPVTGGVLIPERFLFSYIAPVPLISRSSSSWLSCE